MTWASFDEHTCILGFSKWGNCVLVNHGANHLISDGFGFCFLSLNTLTYTELPYGSPHTYDPPRMC